MPPIPPVERHEKAEEPEPHLTGVKSWVHEAIKETYSHFGDGKDRNSAGCEHRNLAVKALDFLQIIPYAEYYGAYHAAKATNWIGDHLGTPGKIVSHTMNLPLAALEIHGLAGNEMISAEILALNHGKANMYEGIHGTILPHFACGDKVPRVYLPGIHFDGKIDFEW